MFCFLLTNPVYYQHPLTVLTARLLNQKKKKSFASFSQQKLSFLYCTLYLFNLRRLWDHSGRKALCSIRHQLVKQEQEKRKEKRKKGKKSPMVINKLCAICHMQSMHWILLRTARCGGLFYTDGYCCQGFHPSTDSL